MGIPIGRREKKWQGKGAACKKGKRNQLRVRGKSPFFAKKNLKHIKRNLPRERNSF